jgi:cytidylate kinase
MGEAMRRIDDIDRYLRATLAAERVSGAAPVPPDRHPFVTISRQAGTGAHALADVMADVFSARPEVDLFSGWQVYDRTLCELVARDPRFARSFDSLVEEEYRSTANDFFHQMLRSTVDQKMVMNRAFLVVRAIAGMGKAIIVGRGGSYVTKDMPLGVSLRMVSPDDHRIQRAMRVHGLDEREARSGAKKRDADRARMIRKHFGADVSDPASYDITVNVASVDYHTIGSAVAALVAARAKGQIP